MSDDPIKTGDEFSFTVHSTVGKEIMRITARGEVIINPDYTPDEAAQAFWEAVKTLAKKEQDKPL